MASHGFRNGRKGLLALIGALALLGVCALPATAAKTRVGTTFVKSAAGTKIQVTLTNTKSLSSRNKPRSVKVKAGGKTIALKRAKASAAAGYASSWNSKNFTGSYAVKLNALNGKRVKVTFKSKARSTAVSSKVLVQTGGGQGGGGPIFPAPGKDTVGNEAWESIKGYFLNSAFSDCEAGPWPLCAVEERYVHCPDFTWLYQRTSNTGADVDSRFQAMIVQGAEHKADGSWGVQYDIPSSPATYIWRVSPYGIANGEYYYGGSMTPLGPMIWSQPAITWNNTSGAC